MRAIVVGGGIIGVSTAFRLAQGGADVTLLEAHHLACGTSSTSFAWMNSNNKAPLDYHRLNVGGMAQHHLLAQELGSAPWLHLGGNLMWDAFLPDDTTSEPAVPVSGERLSDKIHRLREWNYPVEVLTRADISALQPAITVSPEVERFAWFPTEGYIDVPLLVAHLAAEATSLGATIQTNQRVTELLRRGDRVIGVKTEIGDQVEADMVVSCVGRWTDELATLIGRDIAMAPTLGLLVVTCPVATTLQSLVHSPRVNIRPAGGSRLVLASFDIDRQLRLNTSREALDEFASDIFQRATEILPALQCGSVESTHVGIRSIPQDGFPVIGSLPGIDGLFVIATHSGVTMGPLLGRLAAREILHGERDERIAAFRPDRLH